MEAKKRILEIGTRIKEARNEKGLTQKALAEKLDVSTITIQNYENNRRKPSLEMINKISEALDMTFNDLVNDYSNINPRERIINALNNDIKNRIGVELKNEQEYDLKMNSIFEKYFFDLFFWKTSSMDNKTFFKFILSMSTNNSIAFLTDEDIEELAIIFSRLVSLKSAERETINNTNKINENYNDIAKRNFLTSINEITPSK